MLGVQQAEPAIMEEEEEEDALEGAFSMMLDEENVRPHRSPSNVGEDGSGKRVMGGRDDEDTNEVHKGQAVEANEDTLRAEAVRCAEEFGASSEEAVAAQMQLAMLLIGLMNWAVANEVLRSLLQRAEGGLGLAHELSLQALGTHAGVQWQLEQWEDARDSLTRLVGAREKSLSEAEAAWKNRAEGAAAQLQDAQELAAEASAELASVHVEFGEHEKAVPRYQGALAMQKAAFGELSAPVLGTLDALAASLAEVEPPIGGSELAEQALRSALPLKQALGGKTSQAVADCHNELSVLLQGRGEFELAEEEARRALHVYRQLFGELHVFTATAVNNLALLLQAQGALPQAEVEVRKALRVFQNVLGQAHDDSVAAMRSLVEILWEQEKIEEAAEGLTTQLSLQAQLPDTDYRWMAQGCAGLGSLQWQLENLDEAYRSLDAASQYYELQTKAMREEDEEDEEDEEGEREADRCSVISEHAAALNSMACVLQQLGHEQEALVPLSRSGAIYGGGPHYLPSYHVLSYHLLSFLRSVAMYEEVLGPDHSFVGVGLHNVGLVHWGLGDHAAAQASLEKACRVCEFSLGLFNMDFLAALASLGELNREIDGDLGPDGKVGPSKTALSSGFHKRAESRMQEQAAQKLQVPPPLRPHPPPSRLFTLPLSLACPLTTPHLARRSSSEGGASYSQKARRGPRRQAQPRATSSPSRRHLRGCPPRRRRGEWGRRRCLACGVAAPPIPSPRGAASPSPRAGIPSPRRAADLP